MHIKTCSSTGGSAAESCGLSKESTFSKIGAHCQAIRDLRLTSDNIASLLDNIENKIKNCDKNTTEGDFKELLSQQYELYSTLQLCLLSSGLFKDELKQYLGKFGDLKKLIGDNTIDDNIQCEGDFLLKYYASFNQIYNAANKTKTKTKKSNPVSYLLKIPSINGISFLTNNPNSSKDVSQHPLSTASLLTPQPVRGNLAR